MAKRYSQPQGNARIDWGNPITKGLVGAYLPQGINAVTNAAAVSITAPKTATKQGSGLLFAGGTEVAKYDSYQPGIPFTAVTLLVPNFSSSSATRQGVWVYQATSGSAQNRLRLIWLDATNGFYLDINGGFAYRCKPTFAAGDAIALAYTRAGVTSSNQFYVNGVAATTTQVVDTSNTGLPSPAAPLWLGDDVQFASGKRLNGTIALHLHFSRVLTGAEIKSLSENPWQIFAPAARSIWVPVAAGGDTYTLTADSGSFALTGQDTALNFNRTLAADSGSFALTGQAAALTFNRTLVADSGSFALAGQDATPTFSRVLSAASGSYALAGQDATLTYTPISGATYTLAAASGSFALAGQGAVLLQNRSLAADSGSFALTGQDATLARGYMMPAQSGDYSVAGQDAALIASRRLAADSEAFALTGQNADLTYTPITGNTYTLSASSGSFVLTGQDAQLLQNRALAADAATYALAGQSATLTYSGGVSAIYPSPSVVLLGTAYGPTGTEYTGTFAIPSAADITIAVLAALNATTIPVDTKKMNGATVLGVGTSGDKWRG